MSRFNSSISVLGIDNPKIQQAILKLLENSLYQKELLGKTDDTLTEQIRRIRQQLATIDFDIDEETAQKIADKISAAIGDSVSQAAASATAAAGSASSASEDAANCHEDAASVKTALENMESTIEEYSEQAATKAAESAVATATEAATTASEAATTATTKADAATKSAENAATTAGEAADAATAATQAVQGIRFKNLAGRTTYNSASDQYRKVATLPTVSGAASAVISFWGAMGGWTNNALRPISVTIGNRQSSTPYTDLSIEAYYYKSTMPTSADIVIYKESDGTFSVYLKGALGTYFRHEIAMMYNENVTVVTDTFKTGTPTGTLVWSFLANAKRVVVASDLTAYSLTTHNHDSVYAAKTHNHNGTYQPAGSYAAANHNHDGTYQPAGSYAAANHNHDGVYQPAGSYAAADHNHDSSYAAKTIEKIAWAHINVDLANSTYAMACLVSDTSATYNLKVTFRNTSTTARSCLVNGTTVSLAGTVGSTASTQTTVSGSGSFTIDNIASTVDVFVRIWR